MKIKKILIANRGEIARRIIRTCTKMAIETIAIYADPDEPLPYVREASTSVHLPGTSSTNTYLDGQKIIRIAQDQGADAIHPGYGFLSENAEFAKAVEDSGLIFIGPSPESIEAMGHKIRAKKLALAANVPLIPGNTSPVQSLDQALSEAQSIGYPVLLKAAAGGGGKGMRTIRSDKEMKEMYDRVKSEAKSSFGDEEVFIEKYLEDPKHVEIQLFGDQQGNYVHLFERDCSIQRRHQKVIEEAPCATIRSSTRQKMGKAAIRLAQEVGYFSSGTVEFLMDRDQNFYFLEMNTRLQVEHPVTELITGTDLVKWQILVAEGKPLPRSQDELRIDGHAIELRLYAEDYLDNFSPSPGRIDHMRFPEDPSIRLDMGFEAGQEVTLYFDPMIGKIIGHAEDRERCIRKMQEWLKKTLVTGIDTTIPFGQYVLSSPDFQSGDYAITYYADLEQEDLESAEKEKGETAAAFAHWLLEKEKGEAYLLGE
ncbi:ATP-grasp domain-containing protein [Membranicola marinus]|uniref:ATP-grasp domain-containing protein n=1 Tax=Membranihabitans marinus TaxID=1227546 RepID=A0A953HRM2_9BACT|nr:biotin carboxylase N-terminal domain-containing protein [Membranihabitans marinus]MBY5957095.1 ATP-grasp domain-containing protein [Membranihabitans marinus]